MSGVIALKMLEIILAYIHSSYQYNQTFRQLLVQLLRSRIKSVGSNKFHSFKATKNVD
jgi:hypothetical protein